MNPSEPLVETEKWRYILLNGQAKKISVLNPKFDKGSLISINGLKPFDKKDADGQPAKPTVSDAYHLIREQ
ncbi:MAG: hypothetical protein DI539_30225, partial [Flavobacterium psychrophilum]